MVVFWLRIILFSLMWTYVIVVDSTFLPVSILLFALSLGAYFLLSIPKMLVWKYSVILLFIAVHGYFLSSSSFMTNLLMIYLVLDASFRLNPNKLSILIVEVGILLIFLGWFHGWSMEVILLSILAAFASFKISEMQDERLEQKEIYEELLSEYRRMKRLHIAAEDNARLEERTRIARDIHDSVGHRLTALIMKLEMLNIQEKNSVYEELKEMARESLEETRSAVKALQIKESEGIATVIHLIRKLESENHLRVQFTLNQGVLSATITNEMSVVLYRVIQEALTNIMRHGDTRDAHITLSKSAADDILFEISNPIKNRKPFSFGFGLNSMKERVEEINGKLQVYQTEDRFVVSGKLTKGEKS